jgi:hypothetical protein
LTIIALFVKVKLTERGDILDSTMKKLSKVFDCMIDHVVTYGGVAIETEEDVNLYLQPVLYLVFCSEKNKKKNLLSDKEFVEMVYTESIPKEMPYDLDFLLFAKTAIEDFYFCLYKEKFITKEQYREIVFVLAEKQFVFFSRMSKPQFWSEEKKEIMLAQFQEDGLEGFEQVARENQQSQKIVPFPIKKTKNIDQNVAAYQVRIDLEGYKPPIWRRLLIPAGIRYEQLHFIIQIAFEWENSHMHLFLSQNQKMNSLDTEEVDTLPIDEVFQSGKSLTYIYDMGADWTHKIKVEKILTVAEAGEKVIPTCLKAARDAPIEDMFEEAYEPLDVEILNEELCDYWESGIF